MPDLSELDVLKADLINEWDRPLHREPAAFGVAVMQADIARRPRAGLAIGHSVDAWGRPVLEMRVTAASGPNHARAEQVAAAPRRRGMETRLVVQPRPLIAGLNAAANATPPGGASSPGDGGAVVWRQRDGAAIGTILAGSVSATGEHTSYVMPLMPNLRMLGAKWL